MSQRPIPSLDETVKPIVVGRRFATPQEAAAIAALEAVLDDQPPPPKIMTGAPAAYDNIFDWLDNDAPLLAKVVKPVVRQAAPSQKLARTVMQPIKEVEPVVLHSEVLRVQGDAPAFVAPEFERAENTVTTRDEMVAVAHEVAARAETQPGMDAVLKVVDLPFGMATLRLFCH